MPCGILIAQHLHAVLPLAVGAAHAGGTRATRRARSRRARTCRASSTNSSMSRSLAKSSRARPIVSRIVNCGHIVPTSVCSLARWRAARRVPAATPPATRDHFANHEHAGDRRPAAPPDRSVVEPSRSRSTRPASMRRTRWPPACPPPSRAPSSVPAIAARRPVPSSRPAYGCSGATRSSAALERLAVVAREHHERRTRRRDA